MFKITSVTKTLDTLQIQWVKHEVGLDSAAGDQTGRDFFSPEKEGNRKGPRISGQAPHLCLGFSQGTARRAQ